VQDHQEYCYQEDREAYPWVGRQEGDQILGVPKEDLGAGLLLGGLHWDHPEDRQEDL
jgi:hypothetical protein